MKKTLKPAVPAPAAFWRPLALLALLVNAAFAVWFWRSPTQPLAAEGTLAAKPPAIPKQPRELAPYAALGSFMAENNRISDLRWSEPQFSAFQAGFRASYEGRGLPLDDGAKRLRDEISQKVQSMLASEQPDPLEDYYRSLREKEKAIRTASGLHYRITEMGSGPTPGPQDGIVISFAAGLPEGKSLAALSRTRAKITVKDLLPGLAEGVQLLRVGGKAMIYVPPSLAFPDGQGPAQLPPNAPLVFFVELHEIIPATQ